MTQSKMLLITGSFLIFVSFITALIVYYNLFARPRRRKECITAHTTGKVVGRTSIMYNNLFLPLVEYQIYDQTYTIRGPKFAGCYSSVVNTINTVPGPNGSNIPLEGELPMITNSSGNSCPAQKDLNERYPIGREVDVYYDPDDPKEAFVERDVVYPKFVRNLLFIPTAMSLVIGIFLVIAAIAF